MQDIWIASEAMAARVVDFGASLVDLRLRGVNHALVLGYPRLGDYRHDGQYMGAVIGRYANRIAGGHVPWPDAPLSLEKNENGQGHLHGGSTGFGSQFWTLGDVGTSSVSFTIQSPDGRAGYPGNHTATAIYEIEDTVLRLRLRASSDQNTITNLCHHPYFNLDGQLRATSHHLMIAADHVLPSDAALMPTGEIADVRDTAFDFRQAKPIPDQPYNNTYCIARSQISPLRHAATMAAGRVSMDVYTTQPGLHFYNGYKLTPKGIGHHGVPYHAGAGICLEAQAWPDSPNHPAFPSVHLPAGAMLEQVTEYRFHHC